MPPVKILFACPRMQQIKAWKSALVQDPHIEIIGEASHPIDTLLEAGYKHADIVIIDLPPAGEDPGLYSHLLAEYPLIKVIAVSYDGSKAFLYEKGIKRTAIDRTSPQSLTRMFTTMLFQEDPFWISTE